MAVTFVQFQSAVSTTGAPPSASVTLSAVAATDLIVVAVANISGSGFLTYHLADTAGSVYTAITSQAGSDDQTRAALWQAWPGGTGPVTVHVSATSGGSVHVTGAFRLGVWQFAGTGGTVGSFQHHNPFGTGKFALEAAMQVALVGEATVFAVAANGHLGSVTPVSGYVLDDVTTETGQAFGRAIWTSAPVDHRPGLTHETARSGSVVAATFRTGAGPPPPTDPPPPPAGPLRLSARRVPTLRAAHRALTRTTGASGIGRGLIHLWDRRSRPGGRIWWDEVGDAHATLTPDLTDSLGSRGGCVARRAPMSGDPTADGGTVPMPHAVRQPLTIALAVRRDSLTEGDLFAQTASTAPTSGFTLGAEAGQPRLRYAVATPSGWVSRLPEHEIPSNDWTTACLTDDGMTVALALDGRIVGTVPSGPWTPAVATGRLFGNATEADGNGWPGACAWLAIWNRALTAAEAIRVTTDPTALTPPAFVSVGEDGPAESPGTGSLVPLQPGNSTFVGWTVGVVVGSGASEPLVLPLNVAPAFATGATPSVRAGTRHPFVATGLVVLGRPPTFDLGGNRPLRPGTGTFGGIPLIPRLGQTLRIAVGAGEAGGRAVQRSQALRLTMFRGARRSQGFAVVARGGAVVPTRATGASAPARGMRAQVVTVAASVRRLPRRVTIRSLLPTVTIRRWDAEKRPRRDDHE